MYNIPMQNFVDKVLNKSGNLDSQKEMIEFAKVIEDLSKKSKNKMKEENKMSLEEELAGKKMGNMKDNIEMTVLNGKLAVLNKVTFDILDNGAEDSESSFFASIDSKEDKTKACAMFIKYADGKDSVIQSASTKWFLGKDSINLDIYPEEMTEVISKSVLGNKEFALKAPTDVLFFEENANKFPSEFHNSLSLLEKAYIDLNKEIKKFKAMTGSVDIEDFLNRYMFRKHILIEGEKGGGKTYSVDKKLRDEKIDSEFIAGHEGIEAIDLLGYYIKDEKGNLVWLDGVLTKAFRKAQKGRVGLFIDEMLRIPSRELNILVGSLTPSSAKTYRLRTNRVINTVDGVGETEIIEVPMENLWCIGTTNVGAGYEVDEIDDALADRFRVVVKTTSNSELESILNSYATESGLNPDVVPKLIEFYTQMRDLVKSGELEKYVNTRHLCEVLQLSEDDSEIKSYMLDLLPTWTSQDTNGQPNKAEKDIIIKLIKKIMK